MIIIPRVVNDAGVMDAPITYKWPQSPFDAYGDESPRLEAKIAKISVRGIIALSAGVSEWIAWRLSKHVNDPLLFNYIMAAWANIVDFKYLEHKNNPRKTLKWDNWSGPLREPICATARKLGDAVRAALFDLSIANETVYLCNLAELVLPDAKLFRQWRNWAIERLVKITSYTQENELGVPVPREALDSKYDFKKEMSDQLIDSYLKTLDYKNNPYLRSPEEMTKDGFDRTPYTYP